MTTQTTAPATFPDHIDRHGVGHFVSRTPAEALHPSESITEEMEARGWDRDELARRMGGGFAVTRLALDLYLDVGPSNSGLRIGGGEDFARAFGTSAVFWVNLETAWLRGCNNDR